MRGFRNAKQQESSPVQFERESFPENHSPKTSMDQVLPIKSLVKNLAPK